MGPYLNDRVADGEIIIFNPADTDRLYLLFVVDRKIWKEED